MQTLRARLALGLVATLIAVLPAGAADARPKRHGAHHHHHQKSKRHLRCNWWRASGCGQTYTDQAVSSARTRPRPPAPKPPTVTPPGPPVPPVPGPPATSDLPFAPGSFWNAPLGALAPLDLASNSLVAELRRQVDLDVSLRRGPWINTTEYSTPIYRVPAGQPAVHVTLDQLNPALQAAFDAVPIPLVARAAAGTDQNMVVWQKSTDTMWEFWQMHRQSDGWHAMWGGRMTNVSTSTGRYDTNWGAPATSLPQIGGTITLAELRAGHIDHALAIAIPQARRNVFVWPARRTDGTSDSPNAIPEGTRFRLDPSLNLDSLSLPAATRMLAKAAQRYGMVVRDKSANVTLYGEDPTPTGSDPYSQLLGGLAPNQVLRAFPWDRLQALRPSG